MIRIGRRKLIVPLYRDLAATPDGLAMANSIFAKARDGYHPLAQTTVAEILNPDVTDRRGGSSGPPDALYDVASTIPSDSLAASSS